MAPAGRFRVWSWRHLIWSRIGAGNLLNIASGAGVPDRRHAQWRRSEEPHGIDEVRLRRGEIVREGLHTSLAELRRLGRKGWRKLSGTTIFCIGREKRNSRIPGSTVTAKAAPEGTRVAHKPGHRLSCRDGRGAAERARFREKAPAPDRRGLKGGNTGTPRFGRRTATRSFEWHLRNTWAVTCRNGGITRLRMKSINWPETLPRAMLSTCQPNGKTLSWTNGNPSIWLCG